MDAGRLGPDTASDCSTGVAYHSCELPSLEDHINGIKSLEKGDVDAVVTHLLLLLTYAQDYASPRAGKWIRALKWAATVFTSYRGSLIKRDR